MIELPVDIYFFIYHLLQDSVSIVDSALRTVGQNILSPLSVAASAAKEVADSDIVLGIDMSIEGLRSKKYSVGIFIFLIISLIFFSGIIYMYMPRNGKPGLKTGEKIMFGAIIAGVFLAIAIGWIELIEGYLI